MTTLLTIISEYHAHHIPITIEKENELREAKWRRPYVVDFLVECDQSIPDVDYKRAS